MIFFSEWKCYFEKETNDSEKKPEVKFIKSKLFSQNGWGLSCHCTITQASKSIHLLWIVFCFVFFGCNETAFSTLAKLFPQVFCKREHALKEGNSLQAFSYFKFFSAFFKFNFKHANINLMTPPVLNFLDIYLETDTHN